ncbi:MAG: phosphoribosyltransferase family protein [Bacteroidota bacterium]
MWWIDLLMFFFPVHCLVCGKRLSAPREVLCLECEFRLPRTGYTHRIDNPVSQAFWGRVPIEMGTSLFRFEKGSAYQALLHELKYRGNRRAGHYLGKLLGNEIVHSTYASCDLMVPVPLHRKRFRERGYNQSEIIASGISESTGIPVVSNLLMRSIHHHSQTSLGRYERYENVSGNFLICPDAPDVNGKKILLIDDVVTTGSTLEACSIELLRSFQCLVFIATVSCA